MFIFLPITQSLQKPTALYQLIGKENETPKKILECKELPHMGKKKTIIPKYKSLFNGNVQYKIEKLNMEIREKVRERNQI